VKNEEDIMKRLLAVVLSVVVAAPACAAHGGARVQTAPAVTRSHSDRAVMTDFVKQIPAGTRVRATTTHAGTVRGTLLKTTGDAIFIQPRTRVAEPLVEVPIDRILTLEPESPGSSSSGRAIAIGAAVGAGAALGVLFVLAAIFAGD
jgi:hypothetical protein